MLKIYDTEHTYITSVDKVKDLCITSTLKDGFNTLSFKLPLTDENLAIVGEEYYIESEEYSYVIKEINISKNDYIHIYCNPNIEKLKYGLISVYDAFDINVEAAITKVLTQGQTGWTVEYNSTLHLDRVEYAEANKSVLEILEMIKADYDLEYWYDTRNKVLKVYDHMGGNRGTYFSNELRLKLLTQQSNTYDYITVIYPIGKDGIVIGPINGGVNVLENYQYSNKYKPIFWIQDDIEQMDQLKMAAQAYLDYYSMPIVSYNLELSMLPKETQLGDNIILVDKIKRTKQRQRVVKMIKYPYTPEKDKVELSNQIVNFAETFTSFNSDYKKQIAYIKKNLTTLL